MKAIAILLLFLLVGCTQTECNKNQDCFSKDAPDCDRYEWACIEGTCEYACREPDIKVEILNFSSDKQEYGSKERIKFKIDLISNQELEANITVKGIKPGYWYFIEDWKIMSIKEGTNPLLINSMSPSCTSGCGGVHPGEYKITSEIIHENRVLNNATTMITLRSS
ncbi:hypothetical protein K8R43_04835 [archaeon]|nr:hypothetical protein [archaeon]